jgi:hypothetical protein
MRRHMIGNPTRGLLAALAAALLVACGFTQTAGIQGSGAPVATASTVSGPITGFGSVFVNGVEYGTSAAQITIDGQSGTEAQLRAGQIVTLQGTVNSDGTTGSATTLSYAADVRGPITTVDLVGDTFTVLGQTVRVTTSTVFDDSILSGDITGLSGGASVEVSGFADQDGAIVASRVDIASSSNGFQVKGVVQGLDSTAHTFQINGLSVDYSAAMPSGTLANGSTVLVHGSSVSNSSTLLAAHVEVLPGIGASANQFADVKGIITKFTSASDFVVLGQRVATSSTTALVLHGLTLAAGVEVEVKGKFDAAGVLQAQKVQATPFSASLVSGLVDSVSASGNTLSVMGVTITTSDTTTFDDHSSQHVKTFRLSDLHAGDYVLVSGTESTPGTLDAAALTRRNVANQLYLQGTASNVAVPNFTILGETITTNAQTKYQGVGGGASAATTFFSEASNHVVHVSVSNSGGVLTATAVQIVK